jgi:hypothetical protein
MNTEISYQNRDQSNINPLAPVDAPVTPDNETKKPTDPKIRILLILSIIVAVLIIISIVVTVLKKSKPPANDPQPTPVPIVSPIPTINPGTKNMPSEFSSRFDPIDDNIQKQINFNPPQTDQDIGL